MSAIQKNVDEPKKKSKIWIIIIIIVVVVLIVGGILLWWFVLRNRNKNSNTCTTNADCIAPLICGSNKTCIPDSGGGNGGGNGGCTSNSDCTTPTSICDTDGTCVECLLDTQCEGTDECVNKECVPCSVGSSPTMITAAMDSFNTFGATWMSVPTATSYVVRYESITFGDWVEFCTPNTTIVLQDITCATQGAPANTPCWICSNAQARVKAITPCGETAFSPPLTVLNPTCC